MIIININVVTLFKTHSLTKSLKFLYEIEEHLYFCILFKNQHGFCAVYSNLHWEEHRVGDYIIYNTLLFLSQCLFI